jgi:hypothetical protein
MRIAVLASVLMAAACGPGTPPTDTPAPRPDQAPELAGLPVEMTVRQRTTTPVPGSGDDLRLTIDDVTRNQVMVSLATRAGATVLATISLSPGGSADFSYGDGRYAVQLKSLSKKVFGQDYATLGFVRRYESALSEEARIERLLAIVAASGVVFIRNGAEHDGVDASGHLRGKWRSRFDEIRSAQQFVDLVGTKSSISGEPYQVRLADGRTVPAGDWLRERLAEIEATR